VSSLLSISERKIIFHLTPSFSGRRGGKARKKARKSQFHPSLLLLKEKGSGDEI